MLSKAFKVPARVWTLLPELQPRADPDPDPAPHVDDQRGGAPDSPESPEHVNLSEYEIRRRANIEANNAQLAMFGLGASAAGASEGAPRALSKARPSRAKASPSADSRIEPRRSGRSKKN